MPTLGTKRIKRYIIYGQLIILFSAFTSIYPQVHGLFGERGLVPVAPMLVCEEGQSVFECRLPLLRLVCSVLQLSPSVGLQCFALAGVVISALALFKKCLRNIITFLTLYFLYLNIYEAGGVFMYSQMDHFLLESTILVGILAWFEDGPPDSIALYGIVSLVARYNFMTGATRLLSKCPTWWNLTAFNYYFESQPLPTPLSWNVHHFPLIFKKIATLLTNYNEIILTPFFLIPVIQVRYFTFFCQILLTLMNIYTGNNGILHYNLLVLLLSLLETPRVPRGSMFLAAIIFAKMGYDVAYRLPWSVTFDEGKMNAQLNLSYEVFHKFLVNFIDIVVSFNGVILVIVMAYSFINNRTALYRSQFRKLSHTFFVAFSMIILLVYGTVPMLRMNEKFGEKTTLNPFVVSYYNIVNKWNVVNSYGSYRQNTGLHGRPEIIIEGSHNMEGPWKEIEFRSKPGKLSKAPTFLAPHHPRLDVQMYYAADGTYQQNPFFMSLVHHLMQNTTEVVSLIQDYPFKNRSEPMNFVRAKLYMYHFTNYGEKNWWRRDFQEEYMPTFNKGNEALLKYLKEHKISHSNKGGFVNGPLGKHLKRVHRMTAGFDQVAVIVAAVLCYAIKKLHDYMNEVELRQARRNNPNHHQHQNQNGYQNYEDDGEDAYTDDDDEQQFN